MGIESSIYEVIKYLNCLFEVFLVYYFLESLFPLYEERKTVRLAEMAAAACIIYGINRMGSPEWNLAGVLLVNLGLAWLFFHQGIQSTLLYLVLCVVILSLTEFIFHYIYFLAGIDAKEPGIQRMTLLLVQGVCRFLIIDLLRKNNSGIWSKERQTSGYGRFLYMLPVSTIVLLNGILYYNNFPVNCVLICLGGVLLILSNVGGFFMVEKILEVTASLREAEQIVLKTKLEQKHYQQIEEINQEYAKYVHEIRKTARVVRHLAAQGSQEEIRRIAEQLEKSGQRTSPKIYCSDKILNAVLLDREKTAKQQHVAWDIQLQPGLDFSFLEELDRIVLFGNLLDNAIEAASKTDNGYVKVDISMGNKALMVCRMENNFKLRPKRRAQELLSAKEGCGHGYGVKNVRETAERYHGSLYLEERNGVFITLLTVSNVQKMDSYGRISALH